MKESSAYSLKALPDQSPLAGHVRRLVHGGAELPVLVYGDEVSLQLTCGDMTLLATSYDYFDGCSHWIYLLGGDGWPRDQIHMPDVFGFLHEVDVISADEVAFGFYGTNDRWNLVVDRDGHWSYAPAELLRRPNRFLLAKRYLAARRTIGPPWSASQGA